ncbi:competence protein ComJ [Treponema pedis]|uniref:competence protein ComJ n=1 Tax=Treponema pedis TaxID=409322 RepID=UPI000464C7C7|nr:competence protein ComJ [Treponema pedis]
MKELDLSYKQFCIFNIGLDNPFNDWTDIQVQQGFSIRKESIAVMTISEAGILVVDILEEDIIIECSQRIIEFEFFVEANGVEIATITNSFQIQLKNGRYKIRIQLCSEYDGKDTCYISFLKLQQDERLPRYLKYDEEITKLTNFVLDGKSAT